MSEGLNPNPESESSKPRLRERFGRLFKSGETYDYKKMPLDELRQLYDTYVREEPRTDDFGNEITIDYKPEKAKAIEKAMTVAILKKARGGEQLNEDEYSILVDDLVKNKQESALSKISLSTYGFKNFNQMLDRTGQKSIEINGEQVQRANAAFNSMPEFIRRQLKSATAGGVVSLGLIGLVTIVGGIPSAAVLTAGAAGFAGAAVFRGVADKLYRDRMIYRDRGGDGSLAYKIAEDRAANITSMIEAGEQFQAELDPERKAEIIGQILEKTRVTEKETLKKYKSLSAKASLIEAGASVVGGIVGGGAVAAHETLTQNAQVNDQIAHWAKDGVQISDGQLVNGQDLGHTVKQTADGTWRFILKQADIDRAKDLLGSHWQQFLHGAGSHGPFVQNLSTVAPAHLAPGQELFHISEYSANIVSRLAAEQVAHNFSVSGLVTAGTEFGLAHGLGGTILDSQAGRIKDLDSQSLPKINPTEEPPVGDLPPTGEPPNGEEVTRKRTIVPEKYEEGVAGMSGYSAGKKNGENGAKEGDEDEADENQIKLPETLNEGDEIQIGPIWKTKGGHDTFRPVQVVDGKRISIFNPKDESTRTIAEKYKGKQLVKAIVYSYLDKEGTRTYYVKLINPDAAPARPEEDAGKAASPANKEPEGTTPTVEVAAPQEIKVGSEYEFNLNITDANIKKGKNKEYVELPSLTIGGKHMRLYLPNDAETVEVANKYIGKDKVKVKVYSHIPGTDKYYYQLIDPDVPPKVERDDTETVPQKLRPGQEIAVDVPEITADNADNLNLPEYEGIALDFVKQEDPSSRNIFDEYVGLKRVRLRVVSVTHDGKRATCRLLPPNLNDQPESDYTPTYTRDKIGDNLRRVDKRPSETGAEPKTDGEPTVPPTPLEGGEEPVPETDTENPHTGQKRVAYARIQNFQKLSVKNADKQYDAWFSRAALEAADVGRSYSDERLAALGIAMELVRTEDVPTAEDFVRAQEIIAAESLNEDDIQSTIINKGLSNAQRQTNISKFAVSLLKHLDDETGMNPPEGSGTDGKPDGEPTASPPPASGGDTEKKTGELAGSAMERLGKSVDKLPRNVKSDYECLAEVESKIDAKDKAWFETEEGLAHLYWAYVSPPGLDSLVRESSDPEAKQSVVDLLWAKFEVDKKLRAFGVCPVGAKVGEPFDPDKHEPNDVREGGTGIAVDKDDNRRNTIAGVVRVGYSVDGKLVLKPIVDRFVYMPDYEPSTNPEPQSSIEEAVSVYEKNLSAINRKIDENDTEWLTSEDGLSLLDVYVFGRIPSLSKAAISEDSGQVFEREVEITRTQLETADKLDKLEIRPFAVGMGKEFNPDLYDTSDDNRVFITDNVERDGKVAGTVINGYKFGDKVVRKPLVRRWVVVRGGSKIAGATTVEAALQATRRPRPAGESGESAKPDTGAEATEIPETPTDITVPGVAPTEPVLPEQPLGMPVDKLIYEGRTVEEILASFEYIGNALANEPGYENLTDSEKTFCQIFIGVCRPEQINLADQKAQLLSVLLDFGFIGPNSRGTDNNEIVNGYAGVVLGDYSEEYRRNAFYALLDWMDKVKPIYQRYVLEKVEK